MISPRLQGLLQRYATQGAAQLAPGTIQAQATAQMDAMKAGGLMSRDGKYLQTTDAQGASYLQNLRKASFTGQLPQQPVIDPRMAAAMGGAGNGNWSNTSAGGVNGQGGGGFAGPIASSLPQGGTPTSTFPRNNNTAPDPMGPRGPWGPTPPPIDYKPTRQSGQGQGSRPTGLPRPRR